jgi:hypothetical protein
MIEIFIAIYVFIDDIMIEIGHKEPAHLPEHVNFLLNPT